MKTDGECCQWNVTVATQICDCYTGQALHVGDHALIAIAVQHGNAAFKCSVWVEIVETTGENYQGVARFPKCNVKSMSTGLSPVRCEFGSACIECIATKLNWSVLGRIQGVVLNRLEGRFCKCCGRLQVELFWENLQTIGMLCNATDLNDLATLLMSNQGLSQLVIDDLMPRMTEDLLRHSFDFFTALAYETNAHTAARNRSRDNAPAHYCILPDPILRSPRQMATLHGPTPPPIQRRQ